MYDFDEASPVSDAPSRSRSKIELEVLLDSITEDTVTVRSDETSKPFPLPRSKIRVMSQTGKLATLRMPERMAIDHGLV